MYKTRALITFKHLSTLLMVTLLLLPLWSEAQGRINSDIRAGNRAWERSDFDQAESKYREALGENSQHLHANFNLGTALYRQNRYEEAATHFRNLMPLQLDSTTRNAAAYNYGNALMQQYLHADKDQTPERNRLLQNATEAYVDALRHNPHDDDARHNLSIALQLKHAPPTQQKQQDEQQQQDEQKHEQQLPESVLREDQIDQHIPEHPEGMISREDAERILNAIREKEMQTAEQIHARERKRMERGREFNW